jgi:hypothetical protein
LVLVVFHGATYFLGLGNSPSFLGGDKTSLDDGCFTRFVETAVGEFVAGIPVDSPDLPSGLSASSPEK